MLNKPRFHLARHVSTRHDTFDVSSPFILSVSSLSNSTARHARHVERVVLCRDVTWRGKWNLGVTRRCWRSWTQLNWMWRTSARRCAIWRHCAKVWCRAATSTRPTSTRGRRPSTPSTASWWNWRPRGAGNSSRRRSCSSSTAKWRTWRRGLPRRTASPARKTTAPTSSMSRSVHATALSRRVIYDDRYG